MIAFVCKPGCELANITEKFTPEICARCHPLAFQERVNGLRYWANAVLRDLTYSLPYTVVCDACGAETARLGDRFCYRCGVNGVGEMAERYTSYQVLEIERMTRDGDWTRERKKKAPSTPPAAPQSAEQLSFLGTPSPAAKPRRTRSRRG
jgi:hypothetical protein